MKKKKKKLLRMLTKKCSIQIKRLRLNKRRYYLHAKIKDFEPEDYQLLNPRKRSFSGIPKGKFANKLLKEFGYTHQY
jgi:hypothetical protein